MENPPLLQTLCCLCGDAGFPKSLFRCVNSCNRFQHSYCSNYYSESADPIRLCDWCRSEERSGRARKSADADEDDENRVVSVSVSVSVSSRTKYSGDEIKQRRRDEGLGKGENSSGGVPSPRTATRRYKLLKDVMC